MPCTHKFAGDLHLDWLDFQPVALIVGTFNPGWDNVGNEAQWFYGRTRNNYFWDVLPRLYGEPGLRHAPAAAWRDFCRRHRLALTDLLESIDDADNSNPAHVESIKNYRDDVIAQKFKHFTFVGIPHLLARHPTIKYVYLTRGLAAPFWQRLWQPVEDYGHRHGIKTHTLLTPSGGARFQLPKNGGISLGDYIFARWQQKWHCHRQ